ncbi:hypothetical protein DMP07_05580 [Slackia faecicanis]|uniref:Type I restriction modification DNA specificity domain-containing protein n=1 Tax=Slackia faecicanis TaxID=255723 RepID=A0A3N0AFE4_9ACTN|nr:restriction endonuclease subunit S [Slackia faecicanis]RNL19840.1 hypothetical protein DMP07_05580 [Slackia faecicanis]
MAAKPRFDGEWVKLGELTSLVSRKNKTGQCGAVYSVTNSQGFIPSTEYFSKEVFSKELKTYKLVGRNQIAYNPSRINVGSVALQDREDEVVVSPLYVVFSVDQERLDPAYLLRFLKSGPGLSQIAFQSIGTVRNNLKYDGLSNILLRVPSLEEQRLRIRALVSLEERIETCRSFLSRLDALVKSRFVEMFGGGEWEVAPLSELASIQGGLTKNRRRDQMPLRCPYLRVANVLRGMLCLEEVLEIGLTEAELEKTALLKGDLLFVEGNGSSDQIGRCAVWDGSIASCVHQNHLIRVRFDNNVIPVFALAYFNSVDGREQISACAVSTSGLFTLSTGKIKSLEIPLPPLFLQQEFADFVAEVDKSRFVVQQQIEKLQMLYDSLAQEYFS